MGETAAGAGAALDVVEHDFVEEPVVTEPAHVGAVMTLLDGSNKLPKGERWRSSIQHRNWYEINAMRNLSFSFHFC